MISKLEKQVIKKLYKYYKKAGKLATWKCVDAFKELGIEDGRYIGIVNNSEYIKTVLIGTYEHWTLTDKGIRYMDNYRKLKISLGTVVTIVTTILTIRYGQTQSISNSTSGNQSPIIQDSQIGNLIYQDSKNPNYLNPRTEDLLGLSPEETTKVYFDLLNNLEFRKACSLLPKQKCNSEDGSDVEDFSKEISKYINGYENISFWDPGIEGMKSKVICAKYSYVLKADTNPGQIWETMSFYLDQNEDKQWQITSRVCENKIKEGSGERACPYPASKKYCS